MRDEMYNDDNSYPYDNPSDKPQTENSDDEIYAKEYEDMVSESERYADSASRKKLITVLCIVGGVALLVLLLVLILSGNSNRKPTSPVSSSAEEIRESETQTLVKKGEHYITAGDYESAEEIYNTLLDTNADDEEIRSMHSVLFNFNKAREAFDKKDYAKARRFRNKIPSEYMYYDGLCVDVDDLDDEIEKGSKAYAAFNEIEELIKDESFNEALEKAEGIDEHYLSPDDRKLLDSYRNEAEAALEVDSGNESGNATFTQDDAESLITEYCEAMVEAINFQDFKIVAPFIHKSSPMYNQQMELIEYYGEEGITEQFDGVTVKAMKKLSDSEWLVTVEEAETIFYSDGSSESKTFNWNYTVERTDSKYRLTGIEEA